MGVEKLRVLTVTIAIETSEREFEAYFELREDETANELMERAKKYVEEQLEP